MAAEAREAAKEEGRKARMGCYPQKIISAYARASARRCAILAALTGAVLTGAGLLVAGGACRADVPPEPPPAASAPGPRAAITVPAAASAAEAAYTEYATRVQALARERITLAKGHRDRRRRGAGASSQLLGRARALLLRAFDDTFFPAWRGTPWDYNGTTLLPRRGHIACGYFVTTLLLQAGFRVERARLAQQASERIIRALVSPPSVRRYSDQAAADVVRDVRGSGPGLYLVGLDHHVGFLRVGADAARPGEVRFCHASYVGTSTVTCEDAETAPAFASRYRVVGKLFEDALLRTWLTGGKLSQDAPR